jgi:D-serine deaminase-like pyridoxal phosphate-dependent protein
MLNSAIAKANIHRMAAKAQRLGLQLRPHFKTIQSAALSEWFREVDVTKITVSSIAMARYFADAGWNDITVAFPVNVRAISEVNELASRIRLGILVSDLKVIPILAAKLTQVVEAWVEIDSGDGRSGFAWDDNEAIAAAAKALDSLPTTNFSGLLGHGGFTYRSHGLKEIETAHYADITKLTKAKEDLQNAGWKNFQVSTGDTPACSTCDDFGGADEIRPGNFVFYDVQQQQIGSCGFETIAVALACPVVAIYPERNEVILHGGGVHLGKDVLQSQAYGPIYGRIALPKANGWEMPEMGCYLRSISQEHGVAVLRPDLIENLQIGDLLGVLPVHSCMCADLMEEYHLLDSENPQTPISMMKAGKVGANPTRSATPS